MKLSVMVAMAANRVIGHENRLPWHLPADLKHFKATTLGKPVLMGRKTWESIGRPLPGRTNIVITRKTDWNAAGVKVVHSLDDALTLAEDIALIDGATELMVIGGAEIYQAALPRAQRLYFTEVHAEVEGDAVLPPIDWSDWKEVSRERFTASETNPYDYSFAVFER